MLTTTGSETPTTNPLGPCPYVTLDEIAEHLKTTGLQISRLVSWEQFPAPAVYVGKKSPRWLIADVVAWIDGGGMDVLAAIGNVELEEEAQVILGDGPRKRGPQKRQEAA